MYERIFNALSVATVAGILFIGCSIPALAETEEEVKVNHSPMTMPQMTVAMPDLSKAKQKKAAEDAWTKLSEAKALVEIATSVKEPRYFDIPELIYVGNFYITMYAATVEQCGNSLGITASGKKVTEDPTCWTVAVDPKVIPLGTYLKIDLPGYENVTFQATDTGGDIKNYWIDVFTESESLSKTFNPTYAEVWIIEED